MINIQTEFNTIKRCGEAIINLTKCDVTSIKDDSIKYTLISIEALLEKMKEIIDNPELMEAIEQKKRLANINYEEEGMCWGRPLKHNRCVVCGDLNDV